MIERKYWFGLEVEGRFTGLQTCFVRHEIPKDAEIWPHIYFTHEFIRGVKQWVLVRALVFDKKPRAITFEVTPDLIGRIPLDIYNRCHIIMRLSCPEMELLKSTDTVAIDQRPYNVFTVMKGTMQSVKPEEYGKIDHD